MSASRNGPRPWQTTQMNSVMANPGIEDRTGRLDDDRRDAPLSH